MASASQFPFCLRTLLHHALQSKKATLHFPIHPARLATLSDTSSQTNTKLTSSTSILPMDPSSSTNPTIHKISSTPFACPVYLANRFGIPITPPPKQKRDPTSQELKLLNLLKNAVMDNDPISAWKLYVQLTIDLKRYHQDSTPELDDVSMDLFNDDTSATSFIPEETHRVILHMVKKLTVRWRANLCNNRLPMYVICSRVEYVLSVMYKENMALNDQNYEALVDLYARAGRIPEMEFWFNELYTKFPVHIRIANSVLSGYVRVHNVEAANQWVNTMVYQLKIPLNSFSYFLLMTLHARSRNIPELSKTFFASGGVLDRPEKFTCNGNYSNLVNDLISITRPNRCVSVNRPSSFMYAELIKGYGGIGDSDACIYIATDFLRKHVFDPYQSEDIQYSDGGNTCAEPKPTEKGETHHGGGTSRVLDALIYAMCNSGHLQTAADLIHNYSAILKGDVSPSMTYAINHILKGLRQQQRYKEAHKLGVVHLRQYGINCRTRPINSIWHDMPVKKLAPPTVSDTQITIKESDHGLNYISISHLQQASAQLSPSAHEFWKQASMIGSGLAFNRLWKTPVFHEMKYG